MLKSNLIILLTICLFVLISVFAFRADSSQEYDFCLKKSYDYYKNTFMTKDGRIMDPDKNNITTSEGQSYIMLRSLTVGDRKTFDVAYKWTKNNLQRQDKLFAWLWGEDGKGQYKILDDNSASDADVDIAFALILAYEKWGKYQYLMEALPIINAIWDLETRRIGSYLVLMPGVEQTLSEKIEINPSYFSPYAFRFFQKYDNLHDWNCLIDSSYYYLNAVTAKTATGLPPNWFLIGSAQTGSQIILEDSPRSDFSYDAVRVFVRIYLDYIRTGDKRDLAILEKSKFFIDKWKNSNNYYVNYKANGELRDKVEFIGLIGILLPIINDYDKELAFKVYKNTLEPYFQNKKYWEAKENYYAKNLLWFGCYLYNKDSNEYKDMHKRRITGF